MEEIDIRFEDLPKAMSWVISKLNELDSKIDGLSGEKQTPQSDRWMDLQELREYLPNHPASQTVYGWTSNHLIPYHKKGKRIVFLKSEIDAWLNEDKMKSQREIEEEAFLNTKSRKFQRR